MDGDIPPQLHSAATDGPFRHCIDCGTDLLDPEVVYAIEKVVRLGEVVFEYALCGGCARLLLSQFSAPSLEAITAALPASPSLFLSSGRPDRCQSCGCTGTALDAEHSVLGICRGPTLVQGVRAVCGPCAEAVASVLSERTREVQGEFFDRTMPGVPAGLDLPLGVATR